MSRQFKICTEAQDVELQLIQPDSLSAKQKRSKNAPGGSSALHMQTMNDDGDIQLVDDIELFSPHEAIDRGDYDQDEDLEYQTNDLEDSQRIRLIPSKNKQKAAYDTELLVHRDDDEDDEAKIAGSANIDVGYGEKEPLSLQIKSKL